MSVTILLAGDEINLFDARLRPRRVHFSFVQDGRVYARS